MTTIKSLQEIIYPKIKSIEMLTFNPCIYDNYLEWTNNNSKSHSIRLTTSLCKFFSNLDGCLSDYEIFLHTKQNGNRILHVRSIVKLFDLLNE